jgi:two-component system chemotaxis response regulator CheV
MSNSILTESGTNEVEFVEFILGGQSFAINVAKVREIIPYKPDNVTAVPDSYHSVVGMFILRDSTLPVIDLKAHLGLDKGKDEGEGDSDYQRQVVLVCEFNDMVNGFIVDGVNQIRRCSWQDIIPLSSFISQYRPSITSSVTIEGNNIMMVDLEHVLTDIYPKTRLVYSEDKDPDHATNIERRHQEREKIHLILADDSPIVRASVKKITDEVGYTNISMHDNGLSAYKQVQEFSEKADREGKDILDYINIVITDIEMPQMDGLTVTKKIKEELGLDKLPVIIFSSLINDQMIDKCKSVGADGWANKLKVADLVHILDKYCLDKD